LKHVEFGDDNNQCNIQATMIIRFASFRVMEYLAAKDVFKKDPKKYQELEELLRKPNIRANEVEQESFKE